MRHSPENRPRSRPSAAWLAVPALGLLLHACESLPPLDITRPLPGLGSNVLQVRSHLFLDGRTCWVYLPPGYETSDQRYPVMYMLDGQDVFARNDASWHADLIADSLIGEGLVPPFIMVAIRSLPDERIDEYSPWQDDWWLGYPVGGGGDAFLAAVESDLMPLIDGAFRTDPSPSKTIISGASLGGLMATYAAIARRSFGRAIAFSPAYWWGADSLLRRARAEWSPTLERLYQVTGAFADNSPYDLRAIHDVAVSRGMRDSIDVMTFIDPLGYHDHASLRRRLAPALRFVLDPLDRPAVNVADLSRTWTGTGEREPLAHVELGGTAKIRRLRETPWGRPAPPPPP